MAIGLNTKVRISGLDELQKKILVLKKLFELKNDKKFQNYLQQKCLEVVNIVSISSLPGGELTNKYILNNKIEEHEDGFVIYNDTYVETETEGYGGKFSIALAFEYGTGIVGQNNPIKGAWQYNVNQHEKGWIYFADGSFHITSGLRGMEIYRNSKIEIERKISDWVLNYAKEGR